LGQLWAKRKEPHGFKNKLGFQTLPQARNWRVGNNGLIFRVTASNPLQIFFFFFFDKLLASSDASGPKQKQRKKKTKIKFKLPSLTLH
jgi:hypothetical protein